MVRKEIPIRNLSYNFKGDHYDFDRSISPTAIAHSLAKERWSRELFQKLKDSHQAHYEQVSRTHCVLSTEKRSEIET